MANFNKVILAGNLTRDPELRYLPKGTAVAKISMAINRTWRSEAGESKTEVTYVDVEAFAKQAETLSQYVKKGSPLLVEGRLKLDQWDDKQTGQKRSRLSVVLEGFQFLGTGNRNADGGGDEGGSAPAPRSRPAPSAAPKPEASDEPPPSDDDVPF